MSGEKQKVEATSVTSPVSSAWLCGKLPSASCSPAESCARRGEYQGVTSASGETGFRAVELSSNEPGGPFSPAPPEMLFHVKLPFAAATTVNAWRDGVPPAPQPTHYEAWVSFPDLVAIIQAASGHVCAECGHIDWREPS